MVIMKSSLVLYLCFYLLSYCLSLLAATDCHHKSFGGESTVCVCNFHGCDSINPIHTTNPGVIQSYSTSRNGDRFARKDLYFNNSIAYGIKVKLHPDKKMQKIIGFGGGLSDSSGYNFAHLPHNLRKYLIRDYFSVNGIEYSAIRVTIGGSDMSTRKYSNDDYDQDDENLSHFALQPEDLKFKIPFLQMAQYATPHNLLKFFGSTWSAPAWMKKNHHLTNGGQLKGQAGGKYYQAYARYLVRFFKEYQQHNISWWGMTVVNEPGNFSYNSMEMSAEQQRDFLKKDLGPELEQHGMKGFNIMIYDFNIPGIEKFVETVLSDHKVAKYATGIAYHWYANDHNRSKLKLIHKKFPKHFILSTEACESFSEDSLGVWHTAENYANDVIKSLKNYVTGWVDWNMIVDMQGGPSWINRHLNAPIVVDIKKAEYYKQPMFYALGHFSKFLPPGSTRIHFTSNSNHSDYDLVAFERPDGGIVLIILNTADHPKSFLVEDSRHGKFNIKIKEHSIRTLLWY